MKKRIGELLVDAGVVSDVIIQTALREKREDQKIGDFLVERGYVKEEVLFEKLSEQLKTPLFKLREITFKPQVIDIVSKELLKEYVAFPVELSGSLLTIAMADPLDDIAIEKIEESVQLEVSAVLATKSEILDYINKYYDIDDSIQEFFNIHDKDINDKNELQVIDAFYSIINKNKKCNLIISQLGSRLELIRGDFKNTEGKELHYLLSFIKKITDYEKNLDRKKFSVTLNREDGSKVKVSLYLINEGSQKEYWIEAQLIEYSEIEGKSSLYMIEKPGLYLVINQAFNKNESFRESLVGLNNIEKFRDGVLVYTDDISYEGYGLKTLDVPIDEINYFTGFADVFVFEKGWLESNMNAILHLLSKGKFVLLQVPFSDRDECENYFKSFKNGMALWNLVRHTLYI